jgi:chemotaxis protein MotB
MEPARVRPPPRSQPQPEPEQEPRFLSVPPDPDSDLRPLRRSSVGLYVFAILLSIAAVGIGGYAWQLLNETEKLKSDVAGLEQVKSQTEQRVAQLVRQSGEQQKLAAETSTERDELKSALAAATAKLIELEDARAAANEQLAEFKDLRAKFQRMIDSGALDINFRRGRMIVEMPAAVLFESGSAGLSAAGKDTIIKVAKILRGVPRHRFLVGGHTDNVPAVKEYKSNWELSAARALTVTDTLIDHGLSPKRIAIAGYSEYDPVASNSSDAGRQKNRRIEIMLEPYVNAKLVEGLLEDKAAKDAKDAKPAAPAAKKK